MAIQLSPSVVVQEKDLTNVIPAVATSVGATIVDAAWGPVLDPVTVDSENSLVREFGKPNAANAASWFTAANFLSYSNNLLVVRTETSGQLNAVESPTGSISPNFIINGGSGYLVAPTITFPAPTGGGTTASVTANVNSGSVVSFTINTAGTGYTVPPVITIAPGSGITATATAVLTNGSVSSIILTEGGTGYNVSPVVTVAAPPGKVTATGTALLTNGVLTSVILTNPGSGYTGTPAVTVTPLSNGTTATGTAVLSAGTVASVTVDNGGTGYTSVPTVTFSGVGTGATGTAVLTGTTVTSVTITNAGSGYGTTVPTVTFSTPVGVGASVTATVNDFGVKINNESSYDSLFSSGGSLAGQWAAKYPGALGNSITVSMADSSTWAAWAYKGSFDSAPGTSSYAAAAQGSLDELHIAVIDRDGKWSGSAGSVLETFSFVSKARDAKKEDGSGAYYKDVVNSQSSYVWWMNHPTAVATGSGSWGREAQNVTFQTLGGSQNTKMLSGGRDDFVSANAQKIAAFSLLSNDEQYDVNLVMCGKADTVVANYVIQSVAESRKDCVAFVSPQNKTTGEVLSGTSSTVADSIIEYRNAITSSSYAVIDSGYKYQYDRYADQYRWIPLNGDIAGLCARTDFTDDPWFSPAGLNRGQIKNVVKLAYSPRKTDRDTLYKNGVNPVVAFPGQGVVLFGDKTAQSKPSAFDRINVRRLFITLEKAIATAAKYQLFEFNDGFTRAQFKNIVEPFLRDVKGRRGITDFLVVCDETNNTGEVIDTNRFVADIFIKPARSINFIQLNFIATRTGASFSEIAGS